MDPVADETAGVQVASGSPGDLLRAERLGGAADVAGLQFTRSVQSGAIREAPRQRRSLLVSILLVNRIFCRYDSDEGARTSSSLP